MKASLNVRAAVARNPGCLQGGHAEVEQLHLARSVGRLLQEQVRGLHVAVHDTSVVHFAERVGRLADELHGIAHGQRAVALHALGQRLALQQLHHDVGEVAVARHDVEHPHDVGAAEPRGDARFAEKASLPDVGGLAAAGAQHLHSNVRAQPQVHRLVDVACRTGREQTLDPELSVEHEIRPVRSGRHPGIILACPARSCGDAV